MPGSSLLRSIRITPGWDLSPCVKHLNNAEVLAVAYEYTLGGETLPGGNLIPGWVYRSECALMLKMLKSSITQLRLSDGRSGAALADHDEKRLLDAGVRAQRGKFPVEHLVQ